MTTKELDMKLARDIARIRMVTRPTATAAQTETISDFMITVMKELDSGNELTIYREIESILSGENQHDAIAAVKLSSIMTESYAKAIMKKLKIRLMVMHQKILDKNGSPKKLRKFTEDDYAEASILYMKEINKAVEIIKKAITAGETTAIINLSAIESYGYNTDRTKQAIQKILLNDTASTESLPEISIEFVQFINLNIEAIEHLDKVKYYENWIYERFCPAGIVKVLID